VLSCLDIPRLIVHSLFMLGQASGGVVLFACGIVLASAAIKFDRRGADNGHSRHAGSTVPHRTGRVRVVVFLSVVGSGTTAGDFHRLAIVYWKTENQMTQVEALAKYAARASFDDISTESRKQLSVHILDSLGCCIAALDAEPIQASGRRPSRGRGPPRSSTMPWARRCDPDRRPGRARRR
jgi:hypothetical protein